MGFSQLFTGVVTIIGTIGFMLSVNVWTTLVVVLVTPLSILVARFIAKKTFAMFRLQSETRGRQTAFINEMITNQKVVRAYCVRGGRAHRRFSGRDRTGLHHWYALLLFELRKPVHEAV